MTETTQPAVESFAAPDALATRLFEATLGAMDLFAVYLGHRLGYYRALAEGGPATSGELAQRTGTAERYAREWLEQQAVTGMLTCDNAEAEGGERRFRLPAGYEAVLVDPDSLTAMAPIAQILAGCVKPLPVILDAFRTGGGVPYADYGVDLHEGQAGTTRPQFRHLLAQEWLPAMPDVHARLNADPPARVADIGMGLGWSSIAIARAYPSVRVDGFDLDEASVQAARANAADAGVADRVTFHVRDAGDVDLAGRYDFALAVECIHDMPNPVEVLGAMRQLVGDGGTVLIVDEKVAERFMAPGDEVERFMYGFSILHCLPVGMVEQPSAATGTVMRAAMLRRYAQEAGFRAVETLPIEHDFFRFYRLAA
ncbi:MAG: methyltransferase domain-containing protein [Chloroflexota bacterium]|nr:methyltransferase domain-containing protein [Chloroflexota bacterium]MDP9471431.1 methyltransferase domain-containing protein [Chloroflexota bacterium]